MKAFGINEKGNINNFEVVCTSCGSHDCEVFTTHFYGSHDFVHPKEIKITFRCKRCKKEYSCTVHEDDLQTGNKDAVRHVQPVEDFYSEDCPCSMVGYCPFDNKIDGFPCLNCPRR